MGNLCLYSDNLLDLVLYTGHNNQTQALSGFLSKILTCELRRTGDQLNELYRSLEVVEQSEKENVKSQLALLKANLTQISLPGFHFSPKLGILTFLFRPV